jgi:hypothetical protein
VRGFLRDDWMWTLRPEQPNLQVDLKEKYPKVKVRNEDILMPKPSEVYIDDEGVSRLTKYGEN